MNEYKRKNASFSLCGLNCCLCPRFHTDGPSRCPGCGGTDFALKHPACAVITCNKKHDGVEYCFECSQFPCEKYQKPSKTDSFISYRNVLANFSAAQKDLKKYSAELNQKVEILLNLLKNYNDGKLKGFYCLAVDLLPLSELSTIMELIDSTQKNNHGDIKQKAKEVADMIKSKAKDLNIELQLRK